MTTSSPVVPAVFDGDLVLRLAASTYLGRFTGISRSHTESDLRLFFTWCADHQLWPFELRRAEVERHVRWMQEVRKFKPSTVSRRMAVVSGFYRTCVIDAVLEHLPADYVRRPPVPNESPTLGLSHLQFEALLTAARNSANRFDFVLVAMLGLLGLRIFEACGTDIADVGEDHGNRVLRVLGKGTKLVLVPLPPAVGRALDRAINVRMGWADPAQPARCPDGSALRHPPSARLGCGVGWCGYRGCIRTCCATPTSPPCSTPASRSATPRSTLATPIRERRCATTGPGQAEVGGWEDVA